MNDFNITLFEACELLNRSKKSISRYIRRGLLHPERVKSQQGTLEYRFSKADIEAFRAQEAEETRQDTADGTEETGQTGHIKTAFIENKEVLGETRQDTPDQTGQDRQDTRKEENGEKPLDKGQTGETGQDRGDRTGQDGDIITLLKETTGLLKEQLVKKDEQIKDLGGKIDQLIERDRETNFILKSLQDKVFLLEEGRVEPVNAEPDDTLIPSFIREGNAEDAIETAEGQQDEPEDGGLDKQNATETADSVKNATETPQDTPQEAQETEETGQDGAGRDKQVKPLKEKKTKKQGKAGKSREKTAEAPKKKGFWQRVFK